MPKAERALRQHNREQIKQHPEWFPAPLKASDRRWQALAENNHFLSSVMRCITIAGQPLWRITTCAGESALHIHSREIADHMGVYLGDGSFLRHRAPGKPFG